MNSLLQHQIDIPTIVRIQPGAVQEVGSCLKQQNHGEVFLLIDPGLPADFTADFERSLKSHGVTVAGRGAPVPSSFEHAQEVCTHLPAHVQAVVGLGDDHALNFGKYLAFLARLPFHSVPIALTSNGFVSPQAELHQAGLRRSFTSSLPFGVFIDTELCLRAPPAFWCAGVGAILAKITAIFDWKLAYHRVGTPLSDLSILLASATVFQLRQHPERDLEGARLLGLGLLLSGLSVEIAGSSRPAYGSEHLISHVLDSISARPRLRGLQVGMAAYIVSLLQGSDTDSIEEVLGRAGFWDVIRADPFSRSEWLEAVRKAPSVREDLYTILSTDDWTSEVQGIIDSDPLLKGCFVE